MPARPGGAAVRPPRAIAALRAAAITACLLGGPVATPTLAQPAPRAPAAPATAPAPPPAAAPAPAPAVRAWTVSCAEAAADAPRDCQLSAQLLLQPQNQPLARVILSRQPETRSLGLVFQMPHGALLPPGMAWQVDDGETQRLAFQTSDAGGLYAGVPMADDLLAALRRAGTLRLSFVLAARREQLVIPVPLAGFSDAVTEFLAAERGSTR